MKRHLLFLVFLCVCATACIPGGATASEIKPVDETLPITAFTDEELAKGGPIGWEVHPGICRKILKKAQPRVLELEGKRILQVKTADDGLVLLRKVERKANQYPLLGWSWKVSNVLPQSREKEEGGDDYPAAVCIVYAKTFMGITHHIRGLIYVWGSNVTAGERYTSPCDERFRIIVVQGGPEGVGQWFQHKVNHPQDYLIEFGEVPDRVYAVGIQTNTDRTHGEVEGNYADIVLTRY
ncbi:MAG: DUF3047 domain-containing protein [Candidatus Brocadiaceae bacterium]|nr:DUF3047 domain-containing protein [Candidatus Brocadiaceae bacterium]